MVFEGLEEVPAEAVRDLDSLRRYGVRSKLVLPLLAGNRVYGGLAFVMTRTERPWRAEFIASKKLIAEVFANALARKESEDALRASELTKSAILSSLNSGVAVLDRQGHIVAVNQSWAPVRGRSGRAETRAGSRSELSRRVARGGRPR